MARKQNKPYSIGEDPAARIPDTDNDSRENPEKELERIRREMGQKSRKKRLLLQVSGVVAFLIVAAVAFLLWNYFRYAMARQPFESMYLQADKRALQTYAPSEWRDIQQLRRQAASKGWFPSSGEACALYNQATQKLSAATTTVDQLKQQYESLRQKFRQRTKEAQANQLAKYLPGVWKQLQQIEKQACDPHAPGFSAPQAIQLLTRACAMLDRQSRQLGAIRAFNAAREEYTRTAGPDILRQAGQVAPRQVAELRNLLARANTAAAAAQWQAARQAYLDATKLARNIQAKINQAKTQAQTRITALRKLLAERNAQKLKTLAETVWNRIQQSRQAADQAFQQARYGDAAKLAQQTLELAQNTLEAVQKAQAERSKILDQLQKVYLQFQAQRDVIQKNWPKKWRKIQQDYQAILKMNAQRKYLKLVAAARAAITEIHQLLRHAATITQDYTAAKKKFEADFAAVRPALLRRNLPDDWLAIVNRIAAARRAEKQKNLRQAVDAYTQTAQLLEQAQQTLETLIRQCRHLRRTIRTSLRIWRRGLRRFAPRRADAAHRLLARAERILQQKNYALAKDALLQAQRLLPKHRFEAFHNGTVADYQLALLWAADGKGPGALGGRRVTWYQATEALYKLDFAGRQSWRLPSDDELQSLFALEPERFKTLFPNTQRTLYWTRAQLPDDVDHAICVDFVSQEVRICPKTDKHPVRAVSGGP